MPYRIYEFDGVALPDVLPEDDLASGTVASSIVESAGGSFDWAGSARRLPRRIVVPFAGAYGGGSDVVGLVTEDGDRIIETTNVPIAVGTAALLMRDARDLLTAKIGVRGSLWRRRESDSAAQWRTARLLSVGGTRVVRDVDAIVNLTANFETTMPGWRASAQSTASLLSDALVSVGGTLPVRHAVLTVTASATITAVTVYSAERGINWTWSGTLAAGTSLVINDEAQTITNAGADAYSGLLLGSGHTAAGWLDLEPGNQAVSVTVVGTASAVGLAWWDVFA